MEDPCDTLSRLSASSHTPPNFNFLTDILDKYAVSTLLIISLFLFNLVKYVKYFLQQIITDSRSLWQS